MRHQRRRPSRILSLLIHALALGCVGCIHRPRDVSQTPEVRQLGLVGLCLTLTKDAPLVEVGKPYPRLALALPPHPAGGGPGKVIGTVRAGTRLRLEKVVRGTVYWDGLYTMDLDVPLGRIESGEHAGKVVDPGYWGWGGRMPSADRIPEPFVRCPDTPAAAAAAPPPPTPG
jgi:hypothetical protein